MKKFKVVLLILLATASFNYCSKDDDKSSTDEAIDGGTVHTSELVRIAAEGISQDLYEATFNENPVQLFNNDGGELVFFVQPDLAILNENNVLHIPALEMTINYKVVKTTLTATPEETLAPLIEHLNNTDTSGFAQGNKAQQFIEGFNNYYASVSEQEKREMAEFYQANLELFGPLLESDRSTNFLGLSKCQKAKFLTATLGGAATILANPATMGLSVLSGAGAVVAFMDAVEYCTDFMSQKLKQVFLKFDDMLSSRAGQDNSLYVEKMKQQPAKKRSAKNFQKQSVRMLARNTDEALTFGHGEPQSFSAANGMRSLQASDASDTNSIIAEFFSLMESLNSFVLEKLNGAISYYNSEVPDFFEVDLFEVPIVVPENGEVETQALDQEIFDAFTFSVGSEEVTLNSINFANGEVTLTLEMADPNQDEISTTLDYVYHDEFNDRHGSFPILVTSNCAGSDLAVSITIEGNTTTAHATGGQPPYTYSWSNGVTGETITDLELGEHTVTVIDSNGCEATASLDIFSDAAAVKAIRVANGLDVSDPRWDSNVESEVIAVLMENGCQSANNRVFQLVMNEMGLTTLSSEIGNLTNLTYLELFFNQLANLPPEIGNLTNLNYLGLHGNQLTGVPQEIGNLTNLTELYLGVNQLISIPPEIGMTNLSRLNLRANQLTSLPQEIGNLTDLTHLQVSSNQLTSLPPEIWNLTNLILLSLDGNQLTNIPSTIGNLTNLADLDLAQNQLTSIPSTIGNLTNLADLDLTQNQLTSIPSTIGNLTNLTVLRLESNQLISVSSTIGNLTNLAGLDLAQNQLTSVPSIIGNLTNLEYLNLAYNQLTSIPSTIGNLTNLNYLNFSDNNLTCLPQSVWDLSSGINEFYWGGNTYSENGETYGLCYFGDTICSTDIPCE